MVNRKIKKPPITAVGGKKENGGFILMVPPAIELIWAVFVYAFTWNALPKIVGGYAADSLAGSLDKRHLMGKNDQRTSLSETKHISLKDIVKDISVDNDF